MTQNTTTDDIASSTAADLSQTFTSFSATESNERCSTVIIGVGIIGVATAFYLSRSGHTRPDTIHLIEASPELFSSASGKSGGFVAEDWFPPATASLGALSFRLHKELAEEFRGYEKWGYNRSTGTSLVDGGDNDGRGGEDWLAEGGSRAQAAGLHEYTSHSTGPSWLRRRKGDTIETMGESGGVAQVDPLRLCQFLLTQALTSGVRLHHPAHALRLARDEQGNLSGLRIRHAKADTEFKIPCTRLLITAGAWTPHVFDALFPHASTSIPVTPLAGHSLVVRSPRWTKQHEKEVKGCHAVFTTMQGGFSPEIFSRVGGEIYIAGLNSDTIPLPDSPENAQISRAAVDELKRVSQKLLGGDGTDVSYLEVVREGLCFRPVTRRGVPILARIEDEDLNAAGVGSGGGAIETLPSPEGGVYVCAGHGPWGISLGLGTGRVLSEMLEGRQELSANVGGLGME